jgi:cell division protein FtsA
MIYENINSKDIIFSLDIGTRSVIGTVGIVRDKKFKVICEKYVEHEERAMIDGQIHDINLVANAVRFVKNGLEKELNFKLKQVAIAAAGRFLRTATAKIEMEIDSNKEIDMELIRGLELTAVKDAEKNIDASAQGKLYCVGYSVKGYFLNGFIISNLLGHKGETSGVEVIATFLPRSVVDSLYAVMTKVELEVVSLTLEPIAAIEAVIPPNLRLLNLALVDIGAGTSDIAISSKDSIAAYGMVPMAGDEVTEVIAQALLVDFNTAERVKRECSIKELITYTDVLGLENTITKDEIMKMINPVVEKVSEEITKNIISLNGGKATNAVFLVGGGAHTPGLKDVLAEKLNLAPQRIAIKGREAVTDCVCENNELGSIGVTVLGIALISIKRFGNDFINVNMNGSVVSLFNSHTHNVMDVLMQAGINPKLLIGKNGRNIKFTLNGAKRIAFGTLAQNAKIKINGFEASLESEVKDGDNVEVLYAQDGKEAEPKVYEFVQKIDNVSFFFNDVIYNLEPQCFINNIKVEPNHIIKENDEVRIITPSTVEEFKRYYLSEGEAAELYRNEEVLTSDYIIKERDRIYSSPIKNKEIDVAIKGNNTIANAGEISEAEGEQSICVNINGEAVSLKGKNKYVFIDIFDYIKFDLTFAKGNLILNLNGIKAGYYDELNEGDIIKVGWE